MAHMAQIGQKASHTGYLFSAKLGGKTNLKKILQIIVKPPLATPARNCAGGEEPAACWTYWQGHQQGENVLSTLKKEMKVYGHWIMLVSHRFRQKCPA